MILRNTADRWGPVSQALHWTVVVLILAIALLGLAMDEVPRTPSWFWVWTAHKSLGLTVLALAVVRLGWRLVAGAPAPVPGTPRWQHGVASVTHWALYALIFAMPLSGWIMDSANGLRPLHFFGGPVVPKLVAPDEAIADAAHDAHETLFLVLVVLVAAHAGAALWHHFVQRDATLLRMLPRRRPAPDRGLRE